jgi:hypothetical protein
MRWGYSFAYLTCGHAYRSVFLIKQENIYRKDFTMSNNMPTQTQTFEPIPPMPPQFPYAVPTVPLTKRRWFLPAAVAVGVLFGAVTVGGFNAATASAKVANCKAAFEYADTGLDASGNVIGYLSDGLSAAASRDVDTLNDLAPKIEKETNRLDGVPAKFKTARELCEK